MSASAPVAAGSRSEKVVLAAALGLVAVLLAALGFVQFRERALLGDSLVELHQYEDAEAVLQEETKLEPKSPFAYNTLGWASRNKSK